MDIQFIKLLNKELVADYSYMAYLKGRLRQYLPARRRELKAAGVPFVVSFKLCNIENKVELICKDNIANAIVNSKVSPKKLALVLFALSNPQFENIVVRFSQFKGNRKDIITGLYLDDKPPFFKDRHLQVEFDGIKKWKSDAKVYLGTELLNSISISDNTNFIKLLDTYRFVNLSFNNIRNNNATFVLRVIRHFINEFKERFRYLNILNIGTSNQHAMIDKVNVSYIRYDDFYPVFINDKIYCILIQFTSSLFSNLNYYTIDGYVQNYIIGGSNSSDDLLELDGESNIQYKDVKIDNIIKVASNICTNYTLADEERR